MKHNTFFNIVCIALLTAFLPACKYNEPAMEDIFYADDEASIEQLTQDGKVYSLDEFKRTFMSEKGNYLSEYSIYRTRACGSGTGDSLYIFSLDTIPTNGPGIYIMGRVSTDDYGGNFYKSLVIQQTDSAGCTIPQQALRISVDAGSISGLYPRGQKILIRCNGLAIGRYANQPQLCVPSYNNNVFADRANQKIGWAPGRIPLTRFKSATHYLGQPDAKKLVYDTISSIESITSKFDIKTGRYADGKLVVITDVHYSGECLNESKSPEYCTTGNPAKDKTANVFAPTTENVGYPQSRLIYDQDGSYICVSMSEYAKEANYYLPGATAGNEGEEFYYDSLATVNFDYSKPYLTANLPDGAVNVYVTARKEYQGWKVNDVIYMDETKASSNAYIYDGEQWRGKVLGVLHCSEYVGSVRGVLSYYMDNANYEPAVTNWAVSLCDLSDVDLYKNGQKWIPLEYTPN